MSLPWLWATLSGVLFALAAAGNFQFPKWFSVVCACWALIPFLSTILQGKCSLRQAFLMGGLMGVIAYGGWLNWLLALHPLDWLGVPALTSVIIALLAWGLPTITGGIIFGLWGFWLVFLQKKFVLHKPTFIIWTILGAFGLEALLALATLSPAGFPWVRLAYAFSEIPIILKLLSPLQAITQGHGFMALSVLLTMTQMLVAKLFLRPHQRLPVVGCYAIAGLLALLPWSPSTRPIPLGLPPVITVSGAMPPAHMRPDPVQAKRQDFWHPLLSALRHLKSTQPTVWVFPEEGLLWETAPLDDTPAAHSKLAALKIISQRTHHTIVTGASTSQNGHTYNSILMISPNGSLQSYHKRQLVAFGETFPSWLIAVERGLGAVGLSLPPLPSSYAQGPAHPSPLKIAAFSNNIRTFRFAGLMCAELMSPSLLPNNDSEKIDALIVLANAGWFHMHSGVTQQMLAMARFRSAESTKPLLLALNGGPSGWILPSSAELIQTDLEWGKRSLHLKTPLLLIDKTKDPLVKFKHLD
ncbi:MAG: nitrilase-related carbon-nitrogen hydrolase [Vampirovibrionales bacterium]|nr:nitrilase-related carbon-nitrogen hydrolase [Vampirovibrionales bacterium]